MTRSSSVASLCRLPPEFDDPSYSSVTIQRDLYYGYDTLMENVSDPSHINFAHHKVTGRRDRAKPLPFKLEKCGPWGFTGSNNDTPKITAGFYPPCYYYNKYVSVLCCHDFILLLEKMTCRFHKEHLLHKEKEICIRSFRTERL